MNEETAAPSGRRQPKISKACEECRRRKNRCNGATPCQHCTRHHRHCIYRAITRWRKKKSETGVDIEENGQTLAINSPPQQVDRHNLDKRENASGSISATHITSSNDPSPANVLQLYYGPSSHFSFIQQIYTSLQPSNPLGSPPVGDVEEGEAALDLFRYRDVFFGETVGRGDWSNARDSVAELTFLPYELARTFLKGFFSTTYRMIPFPPSQKLEEMLEIMYGNRHPVSRLDSAERSVLLAALAIGSSCADDPHWGQVLFERADADEASLRGMVNLRAVQASLYLAHYESNNGRPNSAYLYLGKAVRKAYAAGLHRDIPGRSTSIAGLDHVKERQNTYWCLYFHETWFSYFIGRSSSIQEVSSIALPDPDSETLLDALVKISKIISISCREMYDHRSTSLLDVFKAAKSVQKDLEIWKREVEKKMHYKLGRSLESGELGVDQMTLSQLYYHITLLTFRPFLLFYAALKNEREGPDADLSLPGAPTHDIPPLLVEACRYALDAAHTVIDFIALGIENNSNIRGLRFNTFLIESACFALIFMLITDNEAVTERTASIKTGINCLSKMIPTENIVNSMHAIQQMLDMATAKHEATATSALSFNNQGLDESLSFLDYNLDQFGLDFDPPSMDLEFFMSVGNTGVLQ